ncbi:MAG: SpoIIE family protein phosphatase [Bacteroidota bacterium]
MKAHIDRIVKHIAVIILVLSMLIMGYILYELSITKHDIAHSLVEKTIEKTQHKLDDFFLPVKNQLHTSSTQAQMKALDNFDTADFNQLFAPVIKNYDQISSLGIATNQGLEYDIILNSSHQWLTKKIDIQHDGFVEQWSAHKIVENKVFTDSSWMDSAAYDPRSRSWFMGDQYTLNEIHWTDPYIFNTNRLPGITVSKGWKDPYNDSLQIVLAFDLTLEKINNFTQHLKPTENGEVLITTKDKAFVIGAPHNEHVEGNVNKTLSPTTEIQQAELQKVLHSDTLNEPIHFESEGEAWWGVSKEFKLNDEQSFMILIALPERDFLKEINESQKWMAGGFLGILLLTFLIMRSHNKQVKNQRLLKKRNDDISFKNKVISHKNKEILDSITYAKRIQSAILPPERLVKSYLDNSFILYLPKDIVAGDFYWMEHIGDRILFAAADCTGHGVPGAMVSVMCHNALNRSVKEYGLTGPAAILDKTRAIVLDEFSKSEDEMNDGMDISLCAFNRNTQKLEWAGANNPLWIIRKGATSIEEIKPDKQPIGRHRNATDFTQHEMELEEGDTLYIFSDGLQDQFGGPKGKKFKPTRLRELLISISDLSMQTQRHKIKDAFIEWKGNHEQVDDICIVAVKV